MSHAATPVGGPIATRPYRILFAVFVVGMLVLAWRFAFGLGATTAMNDGYPFGLWIVFDVVTGTALATGGYAMAILIYLLNRGRYHPLIRSAVLASALGYTLGGVSVLLDLGRYWNVVRLPLFWSWNLNSILLEVALCITAYTVVLWIELAPAFLEQWGKDGPARLQRLSRAWTPRLERALPWILALGLLLPTMHQTSLGSLMMLAGRKLHPLWQTPMLPALFLVSCVAMGYAAVVIESSLASRAFGRRRETAMLATLAPTIVFVLSLFAVLRLADVAVRGRLGLVLTSGLGVLFLIETALFLAPAAMLLSGRRRGSGHLFRAAMLIVLAGGLYRFSTYLIAFDPGPGWSYFPAVPELLVTFAIVAAELMAYIAIVKRFPILGGVPSRRESGAAPPAFTGLKPASAGRPVPHDRT